MEPQIYTELVKYGGGTALLVAAAFLIREVGKVWLAKRNGNGGENGHSVESIVQKVLANASDNHLHEMPEIIRALARIEEKLDRQFERIHEKLDKK